MIATDRPVDAASAAQFPDMPGSFARIDLMLKQDYASLQVRYDNSLGFPAESFFDPRYQEANDTEVYVVTPSPRSAGRGRHIARYLGPLPPSRGVHRGPSTSVALQSTQLGALTRRVPSGVRSYTPAGQTWE